MALISLRCPDCGLKWLASGVHYGQKVLKPLVGKTILYSSKAWKCATCGSTGRYLPPEGEGNSDTTANPDS